MDKTYRYKSQFEDAEVRIVKSRYSNGRTALELVEANTGEPVARVTVNVPEASLREDEILVKDWSENRGMLEFLESNGIATTTGLTVPCGYVHAHVCRLTGGEFVQ